MPAASLLLDRAEWSAREAAHENRADALTAAHRERARRQQKHPVEDFLFTYYSYKPGLLRRWHPGAGVVLADAASTPRADWRWYVTGAEPHSLVLDEAALRDDRATLIDTSGKILRATAGRPARFGCFGLHEWAMVYRQVEHRHDVPLRLGQRGTDDVVDAHDLACSHFDAFRFFTADAVPRNRSPLSRDTQTAFEQPGCLHAGMDVYKWAVKLGPLVPGDLLLDAFALARDIRTLDMRASPYDLREWGHEPVRIEDAEGKADYVAQQRVFAQRAGALRSRLIGVLTPEVRVVA